jgi:hypothetical protein
VSAESEQRPVDQKQIDVNVTIDKEKIGDDLTNAREATSKAVESARKTIVGDDASKQSDDSAANQEKDRKPPDNAPKVKGTETPKGA